MSKLETSYFLANTLSVRLFRALESIHMVHNPCVTGNVSFLVLTNRFSSSSTGVEQKMEVAGRVDYWLCCIFQK